MSSNSVDENLPCMRFLITYWPGWSFVFSSVLASSGFSGTMNGGGSLVFFGGLIGVAFCCWNTVFRIANFPLSCGGVLVGVGVVGMGAWGDLSLTSSPSGSPGFFAASDDMVGGEDRLPLRVITIRIHLTKLDKFHGVWQISTRTRYT